MKLLTRTASLLAVAGLALTVSPARAAIVAENTVSGAYGYSSGSAVGQSFTVTGTGAFTNIRFNFFLNNSTTPHAGATAFLLSSEYLGVSGSLSSGTPGFLGSAAASGGFYSFGSGVTLVAGTQYFLYTNGAIGATIDANTGLYTGGSSYDDGTGNFVESYVATLTFDTVFRVTGDAVATPDGGSTVLLLALGLAGLGVARRRQRA